MTLHPETLTSYLHFKDIGTIGYFITVVPNLFDTRDRFRGRQFFHGRRGLGDG